MRFSTVFSVLACGAMALAAVVSPGALVSRNDDGLVRRDNAGIVQVVGKLETTVGALFVTLDKCLDSACTDTIVTQIAAAIDVCNNDLIPFKGVGILSVELADALAKVFVEIVVALDKHKATCAGKCGTLAVYAKVDLSLSQWLKQLALCAIGILALFFKSVAVLLADFIAILEGIACTLILGVFRSI